MAPSKLRRAIEAVKDQTTIGLAKVSGRNSISDLEVAILKATRHQETPPEERHIREIINLTSYCPAMVTACVTTIARRLNKTKNWIVALKALMLIQSLLCDGDHAYEHEIFFSTRRGTRFLNMSDFRDSFAKSDGWEYSAFVRTYALFIDELLEFRVQGRRSKRRNGGETPIWEMEIESILPRIHHLRQLLGRFLACRPTGAAKYNRVVGAALQPIVKGSFEMCDEMTGIIATLVDQFMGLEVAKMVRVYELFCGVSKQYDELEALYKWCKSIGIMESWEFPDVRRIPQRRLDLMDDLIGRKSSMLRARRLSKKVGEDLLINIWEDEEDTKKVSPQSASSDPFAASVGVPI